MGSFLLSLIILLKVNNVYLFHGYNINLKLHVRLQAGDKDKLKENCLQLTMTRGFHLSLHVRVGNNFPFFEPNPEFVAGIFSKNRIDECVFNTC